MFVLAWTAPVLIGCQTNGEDSFRVTSVAFDGDSTITLTFTEALAPVDGIDVNDFRLSYATTGFFTTTYYGMTMTYQYASYLDPAFVIGGYLDPEQRLTFVELGPGDAANQLVLRTSQSIASACDYLDEWFEVAASEMEEYPNRRFDAALFLHYASGEIPIESEAGEMLRDVGPDWVLTDEVSLERSEFGFTIAPQLRIPCD
jgi:hypothetical protein